MKDWVRTCQLCGKQYNNPKDRGERKYCSLECARKSTRGRKAPWKNVITRERNPNWKGGVSRIYKTGYYSQEYNNWRRTIFIRDEYTCQYCGDKNVYVTAHHIKSFAHFPKLRFDLENGITLCEKCHSKTDNYKGRNRWQHTQLQT